MYRHLLLARDGPVLRLVLNRPEVRNAFNDELVDELCAWAEGVARDAEGVRAVVLSGAGKTFCAGADLEWMARTVEYTRAENLRDAERLAAMFQAVDRVPVPLVARVHGAALGGGAGLLAVSDIVVAADDTVFGFTEVKLGLVPAVISPFVVSTIGRSAARSLFVTGARFGVERAKHIGLVHHVAPAAELDAAVSGLVAEVLSAAPEAVAAAKRLVAQVASGEPGEARRLAAEAIADRRVSPEGQEGIRAFLEKRRPRWTS